MVYLLVTPVSRIGTETQIAVFGKQIQNATVERTYVESFATMPIWENTASLPQNHMSRWNIGVHTNPPKGLLYLPFSHSQQIHKLINASS